MSKDDKKGWYWENEVTNSKIVVPEGTPAHAILDKIHLDEKKDWALKWGEIEVSEVTKEQAPEIQITLPDGSIETFIDDSAWLEKRAFPRKNVSMKITVISGRRVFRTLCENISLGGLLLKESCPRDYNHPELKVLIESPNGELKILVSSSIVPGSASKRISFSNMRIQDLTLLEKYLSAHPNITIERKVA